MNEWDQSHGIWHKKWRWESATNGAFPLQYLQNMPTVITVQYSGCRNFFFWLCMSVLWALLTAPPTTGAPGQKYGKRRGPCHHLHAYQCVGSMMSERGHYRHNCEEVWYAKYYHTTHSHEAVRLPRTLPVSAVESNIWSYQHANSSPPNRQSSIDCVSANVYFTVLHLQISVFNSIFKWILQKVWWHLQVVNVYLSLNKSSKLKIVKV